MNRFFLLTLISIFAIMIPIFAHSKDNKNKITAGEENSMYFFIQSYSKTTDCVNKSIQRYNKMYNTDRSIFTMETVSGSARLAYMFQECAKNPNFDQAAGVFFAKMHLDY